MATTSSASRSFPTLRYLAAPLRWFFRSRRRVSITAAVLLAMIAAPPLWWSMQLLGLPDIGDPFDMEAFRAFRIPDDRNAFVLYRRAASLLKPLISSRKPSDVPVGQVGPTPKDAEEGRRWVDENREAMALYRQGTERPDALDVVPPNTPESWKVMGPLRSFHVLAQLEAARLEQQGDMAGAYGWYRAAFRAAHHVGWRGSAIARLNANRWHVELLVPLTRWAADPRTTPALLRQALDDAVAWGEFTPSDSYTLKAEYPAVDEMLASPYNPGRQMADMRLRALLGSRTYQLSPEQTQAISDAWRFWRREPERSRRVVRLAIANWLAYEELPTERRPDPDPKVSGSYEFYAFGPEAPAKARTLSPEDLDRWLATTTDAPELLRAWNFRGIRLQERANHRALLVLLASQLYRREHGTDPPSEKALVGPYLESLPDDGLGGPGDQAAAGAGESMTSPGSTGRE